MLGNNVRYSLLSICLCFSLPAFGQVSKADTLNLLTYVDSPLVISEGSAPKGIVVDIVRLLMNRAGIDYSIRFMPPKRAIVMAERSAKHCVFPISRSQEREASFKWVGPILISRHAFYSGEKHAHSLRIMKDAKPFRIGSTLGDAVGEYLMGLGFNVDNTPRNELNAGKLSLQRIDLWLSDTISAPYLAAKKGVRLNPPELVFFTTLRSMGCHKDIDPSLIRTLETTLLEMYRDGSIKDLYQKLGLSFQQ